MISSDDRDAIIELAKAYGAKKVLLFGSAALQNHTKARDIDLAVEGINSRLYFRFQGDLIMRLSSPVDLIDLSTKGLFCDLVRRDGVTLYAES